VNIPRLDGEAPPPLLTLALIDECCGVPLIYAVVSQTGFVLLEEFNDADKYLEWG